MGVDEVGGREVSRVDEDDGVTLIEGFPERKQRRVAEVGVPRAVARVERYAVGVEDFEGVDGFADGGVHVF